MTTLTHTEGQMRLIIANHQAAYDKAIAQVEARAAKAQASLQRRTDARVENAKRATREWKQRYYETRKHLIDARSEINELKAALRNA